MLMMFGDFVVYVNSFEILYEVVNVMNNYFKSVIQDYIDYLRNICIDNVQGFYGLELYGVDVFLVNFRGVLCRLIDNCYGDK